MLFWKLTVKSDIFMSSKQTRHTVCIRDLDVVTSEIIVVFSETTLKVANIGWILNQPPKLTYAGSNLINILVDFLSLPGP